jgi:hypothetical protein
MQISDNAIHVVPRLNKQSGQLALCHQGSSLQAWDGWGFTMGVQEEGG